MPHKIRIIGVPMDLGQSRRGVDMGPSSLRVAGLQARLAQLGHQVEDIGNMAVRQAEEQHFGDKHAKYLAEIAETCASLADLTDRTLQDGFFPLVLGGDHSLAVGSLAGVSHFYRRQGKKIGCLWLDAHGDMNTPETSPSGNIHGMPLAAIIGNGAPELVNLLGYAPKVEARNVALVGLRDLDAKESRLIKRSGVHAFTMRDIDERGMREVMSEALHFCTDETEGFAVSLDMDLVDPEYAPGVGTTVPGGITYRESHLAMEIIADSKAMLSMEIVEINPVIDLHNKTALLGVEMLLSALGKRIL
jgi:arginase